MKIELRNTEDIKPYPLNAKKHPKKQIEQIKDSIQEFGFNQPIVVDKKNVVIVGHGRLAAAKELGLVEVPVYEVDLTDEQAKAYRLADNKLNESDWEMDLVMRELDNISLDLAQLTGFDIETNFDLSEINETSEEEEEEISLVAVLAEIIKTAMLNADDPSLGAELAAKRIDAKLSNSAKANFLT